MPQYFDDIQISDKGMIKLIRRGGKDYIFPASKIVAVKRQRPHVDPNVLIYVIAHLLQKFSRNGNANSNNDTVLIESEDDYFYIKILFTDSLYNRLNDARKYSTERYQSTYGTFK